MKKLYAIVAIASVIALPTHSQILKRISDHAKQKAEQKVIEKIDKSIDDATSGNKKTGSKTDTQTSNSSGEKANKEKSNDINDDNNLKNNNEPDLLKTYSKFDFIPGDKILAIDDFSRDNIGDYPVKWNTNASGEVVTVSDQQGHWLMIRKQGKFIPEYIKDLPDNFTFEYDVIWNQQYNYYSPGLLLYFLTGNNGKEVFDYSFIPWEKGRE